MTVVASYLLFAFEYQLELFSSKGCSMCFFMLLGSVFLLNFSDLTQLFFLKFSMAVDDYKAGLAGYEYQQHKMD